MVITNSYFSKPAYQMGRKLGVKMWSRKTLSEKISSVGEERWNDFLSKHYIKPRNRVPLANDRVNYVENKSV
jgi:restriction system protein